MDSSPILFEITCPFRENKTLMYALAEHACSCVDGTYVRAWRTYMHVCGWYVCTCLKNMYVRVWRVRISLSSAKRQCVRTCVWGQLSLYASHCHITKWASMCALTCRPSSMLTVAYVKELIFYCWRVAIIIFYSYLGNAIMIIKHLIENERNAIKMHYYNHSFPCKYIYREITVYI